MFFTFAIGIVIVVSFLIIVFANHVCRLSMKVEFMVGAWELCLAVAS